MSRSLTHHELYSVAEKDENFYKEWFGDHVQEVARQCLGVRQWIQLRAAITFISRFAFFAINTATQTTTLGEEYCEAQTSAQTSKRLAATVLNNDLQWPAQVPRIYISLIRDAHLLTFHLFGDFYEMAKRVAGVNYQTYDSQVSHSKKLNYLISAMLLIRSFINLRDSLNMDKENKAIEDKIEVKGENIIKRIEGNESAICHLCSSIRTDPTSTLCGHVFCWRCIHQWLRTRQECPICRTPTKSSRLIYLVNFK